SYKGTRSRLFHNLGGGRFEDVAEKAGVGDPTSKSLGVTVLDYNGDGWPDIFVANDTQPNKLYRNNGKGGFTEEGMTAGVAYREAPLLFRNLGNHKFENATAAMGADFNRPVVARGAAYADFDRDGDLDLLISTNHGPAYLFRNDGGNRNHWLCVRLTGSKSNR